MAKREAAAGAVPEVVRVDLRSGDIAAEGQDALARLFALDTDDDLLYETLLKSGLPFATPAARAFEAAGVGFKAA